MARQWTIYIFFQIATCSNIICSFEYLIGSIGHLLLIYRCNRKTSTSLGTEMKSESCSPHRINSPSLPRDIRVNVTQLLGRCWRQLHSGCKSVVCTSRTCLFSNLTSHQNRFTVVHKTFSNGYPDKETPNKNDTPTVRQFRDTEQVLIPRDKNSWNYGLADIKQCIDSINGVWLQEFNIAVSFLCSKRFMCCS